MSELKPWLKNYPKEVPATLEYSTEPVHKYLEVTAKKFPDKVALHFMGKELTFKQLYEDAQSFAGYLQANLGVQKGDRVAIMLPNSPQNVICFFGILIAGGVVVETNPLYTERELEHQMNDSGAKVIVTMDILYPRVAKVMPRTDLKHIIVTAIKDFLPFPKNLVYPYIQKKQYGIVVNVKHEGSTHLLTEVLKQKKKKLMEYDINIDEDIALLQYTGGTTGVAKGVMLTHKNVNANTTMNQAWVFKAQPAKEVILGILPFFHVFGLTTVMILSVKMAAKLILMPKFDALETLKAIQKHRVTLFPGAPTIFIGLLKHPDLKKYDLSSIEACISGSAPLPHEVQEKFEAITGGKLVEGYGLSEASPVTHSNFLWGAVRVKGSIGVPYPDTDSKIVSSETEEEMPAGEIGELIIKGPQVMKGYWNRPEETAQTIKDGWLHTGDLGYMDENGYFYVVDRKKDMIIAGGFNIYPREIEEVLYQHPDVVEAVVAGVPDPYRGETVKAYIVLKEGVTVTAEEMNKYARKFLTAYKVPRLYEFRSELPKTAVGKILRRMLVDEEIKKLEEEAKKHA
ncbi:AMP-binding protein [Bacillus sp. FJAT-29953]|nr:AMP-binding protein [Bacillus sp. FJAT-29953]